MSILIGNGCVTCPKCKHYFEVRQKSGGGADYAGRWTRLPSNNKSIISVWLADEKHSQKWHSKESIRAFCMKNKVRVTEGSLHARISELLKWDLVKSSRHEKTNHLTTRKPLYRLNIKKARAVLENNGKLV